MSRAIKGSLVGLLALGITMPVLAQYAPNQISMYAADSDFSSARIAVGVDDAAEWRASLTGKWTVTISTEQGDFDTGWDLTQHDDGTLTGTIEGRQGSAEAHGGWVKDNAFGFTVTREFQEQSFEIEYEGTFTDDALEGTLTAGGGQFTADFTGVRAGGENR